VLAFDVVRAAHAARQLAPALELVDLFLPAHALLPSVQLAPGAWMKAASPGAAAASATRRPGRRDSRSTDCAL
jgi:hypothetical protein